MRSARRAPVNKLELFEKTVRWIDAATVAIAFAPPVARLFDPKRWHGWRARLRMAPFFVVVFGFAFFLGVLLWKPLPIPMSPLARVLLPLIGSALLIFGMALVVLGRIALGESSYASSVFVVELREGHRLVTTGPYRIIRHPMYAGLVLALVGALLVYQTWTCALFLLAIPEIVARARQEDHALDAEFEDEWRAYRRRVGSFIPRIFPERRRRRFDRFA